MSLYFTLQTVENNKNKKSVKFHKDILNFCDFIQVYVFTTNHHLKLGHFIHFFDLVVIFFTVMYKNWNLHIIPGIMFEVILSLMFDSIAYLRM